MKRISLIIAAVLVITFFAISAFGKPCGNKCEGCSDRPKGPGSGMRRCGPGQGAGPGAGMILRLKDKLNLTDEQVKQLEAIKTEDKDKIKTNREAVKAKREELHKLIEAGADETAIRAAAGEIGKAIGDQAVLKASIKAKVEGILTGAQKTQLKELKEQHKQRCKEQAGKAKGMMSKRKGCKGPGQNRDPETAFVKIDTNGDGAISLEEFTAHAEQMKERHGGKGLKSRRGRPQCSAEEPQD